MSNLYKSFLLVNSYVFRTKDNKVIMLQKKRFLEEMGKSSLNLAFASAIKIENAEVKC